MVISSGKSIPSPQLPSHTLKLNLNTITECVGTEIERLQTRQVYLITPHSQTTPSNMTFGLSRNDSNPNEALLSKGKSDPSPHTHKSTSEDSVFICNERGVAERNRLQFGEVCSITHTYKHNSQTHSHCRRGKWTHQTQPISDSANLPLNTPSTQHSSTPVKPNRRCCSPDSTRPSRSLPTHRHSQSPQKHSQRRNNDPLSVLSTRDSSSRRIDGSTPSQTHSSSS